MFKVFYQPGPTPPLSEVLIEAPRKDYKSLAQTVNQVLATGTAASVSVESHGDFPVKRLSFRAGNRPSRVSVENDEVVFSISPEQRESFISFLEFPADEDLPTAPVAYHHHYDNVWDETGENIARDCVSVVFALLRE